ncbi:MAG: signal peptidase I [Clostridiales bacterium]|nr:signal peptidase I [Clostridiales bacterium]
MRKQAGILVDYKKYRTISKCLMLAFIILSLASRFNFVAKFNSFLLTHRIFPVIWCLLIILFIFFIPRVHSIGKLSKIEKIYIEAMICAVLLIMIQIIVGTMIAQLGDSPYDHSIKGIFNNLAPIIPFLFAREMIRSYVLSTYCVRSNVKVFILVTLIMTALEINYNSLMLVSDAEGIVIFIAKFVGPTLCKNIFLSYLALYGGAVPAIIYVGIITIFHWVSPFLAVLDWLMEGAIGIAVPIFCVVFIVRKYEVQVNKVKRYEIKRGEAVKLTMTAIISIALIWFVVGVFPIVPSVIVTGSMQPLIYPGDIVLLEKVTSEEQIRSLESGDIIQFKRDEVLITHRIIEVIDDGLGNLTYRTKGDNNSAEDSRLVDPNDVKGILVKVVPKVGYPTLLIKGRTQVDYDEIEL